MADPKMRAMVLTEPKPVAEKPLSLRDLPVPDPAAGQVRIRVNCCALCHTDLHTVEGELPKHKRPVVPGHQVVGIVDAIGSGVKDHREGDRVGLPWLHWTDQTCEYCLRGTENLCEHALFTGYDVDGGYAEYVVAPADYVYPIPQAFDDVHAAPLLCAGIIGYRVVSTERDSERSAPGALRLRRFRAYRAAIRPASGQRGIRVHARRGASCAGVEAGRGMGRRLRRQSSRAN